MLRVVRLARRTAIIIVGWVVRLRDRAQKPHRLRTTFPRVAGALWLAERPQHPSKVRTNANGQVTFTTIFPGAYSGRWPHMHFEVYSGLANATAAGRIVATSQLALPEEACAKVYATAGYEQSLQNMARTSLTSDMVFGNDGGIHQLATMSGSLSGGYTAALTVAV